MRNMLFNSLKVFLGVFTAAIVFTALFSVTVSAQPPNTNRIDIPSYGKATLYPSEIPVSGFQTSNTTKFKVTIKNFSHEFPDDVGILLVHVAPNGAETKVRILTDCMGGTGASGAFNVDLTFDDSVATLLPDNTQGNVTTGTYKTCQGTDNNGEDGALHPNDFPAPAPSGPYFNTLTAFNGINPNGTWKLYVDDDTEKDAGEIAGGWELSFMTPTAALSVISGNVSIAGVSMVNARLTLINSSTNEQTIVYTEPFNNGYYAFPPMTVGQTYIISVWAKSTTFTPSSKVVSLTENTTVDWSGQ